MKEVEKRGRFLDLLPLIVFLALFLGTGLYLHFQGVDYAFYKLPSPVAALVGVVVAFLISKSSIEEKMNQFIRGAGNSNIIIMCMIYLFAGAFAHLADKTGGVDATVNLGLSLIPSSLIMPGLFLISAFIATAMGTSMGTISAVAPIAIGMASKSGISLALTIGAVVGGAMFGDNLSMISDTTIAATKTQGCSMKDKFKANLLLVLPAAILTLIILVFIGGDVVIDGEFTYSLINVVPYLLVLTLALLGVNVFVVLGIGILFTGVLGLVSGGFTLLEIANLIYEGFTGMQEIFLLSLFTGGLAEMIRVEGGINYLLNLISKKINTKRGAELGILSLVSVADICTANNTVAIILAGPLAKDIAAKHNVPKATSASLLDIFSCVWQGVIPYGAQVLLAGSLAKISPLEIIPTLYYQFILGIFVIGLILLNKADKFRLSEK
ncbi:Na+/H+ antiporter NhaC family protein [Orenia marismortui]|uniref:Putative methionine transporter (NhaC family) n=1 Tax=Orenia marismortui TaxID=46469 RepID=A0A4R8H8H3_9FIRM|nr:Na+/H+ antiporter NhaC family protein [Orenia marismortui]TDX51529.1 putative methionine transporter (NhaC family) [Orenia marismortui]